MLLRHALEHRVAAARQVLAALFFSHFSTLVLVVVSLAQWGTLAWLLNAVGKPPPLLLHLIGPLAVHTANRRLMVRLRRPHAISGGRMLLLRGYAAAAFTSLFCAVFLLGSAGVWMVLRGVLGALTVEAGTLQPLPTGSTLDEVFRWLSLTGVGTIALAFAYGYTFGQRRLTVTHIRLPLNVPPALHGLRIAQISDIHIGHNLNVAQVARFVRRVNELEPDLICITGDIADGPGADLAGYLPQLGQLRARHGVFAILGNHDHYAGADGVELALRRHTGFTVLRDALATIEVRGTRLHVAGLDDLGRDWCRGMQHHAGLAQLARALPPGEPVLLLSHRPEPFTHAAELGIELMLSGHTHGGQIAMPWFDGRPRGLAWFVTPFERGLYEQDGCYLYVNRGLGVTGPLIRLYAPREISLIEFDAAA